CIVSEVQGSLAGGISGTDEVKVQSAARARFAACRAVVDTFTDETIEALDRQAAPGDTGRKNQRPGADHVASIEKNFTRRRIASCDRAGRQNPRSAAPRPLRRPARQFVAWAAARGAEIVFDRRGRTGLPPRGFTLAHEGAQALGSTVDRRSEAGGPTTD